MQMDLPITVTVEVAGALLGMPRQSAYRAAQTGELPTVKFGRRAYVPVAKLEPLAGRPITVADVERGAAVVRGRNERLVLAKAKAIAGRKR